MKEPAAGLQVEQGIGHGRADGLGDQYAVSALADFAGVGTVLQENIVHDAHALGVGHELGAVSDEAPGGYSVLQAHPAVFLLHIQDPSLAPTEPFHDHAHVRFVHVDGQLLIGLKGAIPFLFHHNLRPRDLKFVTLSSHLLNQDSQMQLPPA